MKIANRCSGTNVRDDCTVQLYSAMLLMRGTDRPPVAAARIAIVDQRAERANVLPL